MRAWIPRRVSHTIDDYLRHFPAVALIGPRQCGKSSLARALLGARAGGLYLDLESPRDLARLADPELFFATGAAQLVCLDEVQRRPELFSTLRGVLDRGDRAGQLLLLGSASGALLRQSSESLAGRLIYVELTPLLLHEYAAADDRDAWRTLLTRGGFPGSLLAPSDALSLAWREATIRAVVERDLPGLGVRLPAATLRRFWQMCAHVHGQELRLSALAASLGVSHPTARRYLDTFAAAFLVRLLPPLHANLKKRLVKSPRLYLRDTGMLQALLGVDSFAALLGHPALGVAWEGMVIEHVLAELPLGWQASYYRTADGSELDLVLERGNRRIAVECKASSAPTVTRGFWTACADLAVEAAYVVAPVDAPYPLAEQAWVTPLDRLVRETLPARLAAAPGAAPGRRGRGGGQYSPT